MLKSEPLYYLVELARCNSYRIASEKLHISQSALSVAIKKLEAELGVVLIERGNRSISLTTIGKKVAMMSESALAHLNEIEQIRENTLTNMRYDHLTIYTFPAISQSVLLNLLTDLQQEICFDKLAIKDVQFSEMMELLSEDEWGFALAWQLENDQPIFANIDHHKLHSTKAQLMLSPKSELIPDDISSIALRDIMQLPLVSYEGGYGINNLLFKRMRECYGSPSNVIEVPNMVLFEQVINSGVAVALGANLALWKSARESGFTAHSRFIPIEDNIVFDFNFYYHKNFTKTLRDYIIATLEKNMF